MNVRVLIAILAAVAAVVPVAGRAQTFEPSAYDRKLIDLDRRYTEATLRWSPTSATDAGVHAYDDRLSDFSPASLTAQMTALRGWRDELGQLVPPVGSTTHDVVDYLLVRADLERDYWFRTVLHATHRDPTVYEGECTNGIFSIVKKPYASDERRLRDAIARLRACPAVLAQGRANLTGVVREFAQIAIEDIDSGDATYTTSLDALASRATPVTRAALKAAQAQTLAALHDYRSYLASHLSSFHAGGFAPGPEQYGVFLKRILMLPYDSDGVAAIGTNELVRDRALELWEANREAHEPVAHVQPAFTSKAAFLRYYEAQTQHLIAFLKARSIVDVPPYIGPFHIVELPRALAATNPGGFMNPPGTFDSDREGFYFVPDYDPKNTSFFAAQARQAILPVLGHEGIPGHFMQFTIAQHLPDYIRKVHDDNVFIEGWAFYGEEMLMRNGLYENDPAGRRAVIHLMRHRATRVGVDVGMATGRLTLPQAIAYFERNAGIDHATARGEATRFATNPGQAIDYLIGKTQIETLAALVDDREGSSFTLRAFHDRLLSFGSIPLSLVRYEWLNDPAWIAPVLADPAPMPFTGSE